MNREAAIPVEEAIEELAPQRRFRSYPEYRELGVEWLGEVPTCWRKRPLKFFSDLQRRSFIDGDWIEAPYIKNEGLRLIQCGNIGTGAYQEQGFRFISAETFHELKCTTVRPGDVLICRMRSS